MVRRGRNERSLRAGRTRVSVRSVGTSGCSRADEENASADPPEIADCFRFKEGGCVGKRMVLGPGEFEKSRGGDESARANMSIGT
jgi:hypothetical protein